MTDQFPRACPDDALQALVQTLENGAGSEAVEALARTYPTDPRLLFLYGSVLAGERRYADARQVIAQAVHIAPGYDIARFQLGFLEFTSGEVDLADRTWAPLKDRPDADPLKAFAAGLMRLPVDDVSGAVERLRTGIASNTDHPALNRDMQMLIDELSPRPTPDAAPPTSETDLLLRQLGRTTRH